MDTNYGSFTDTVRHDDRQAHSTQEKHEQEDEYSQESDDTNSTQINVTQTPTLRVSIGQFLLELRQPLPELALNSLAIGTKYVGILYGLNKVFGGFAKACGEIFKLASLFIGK